MDTPNEMAEKLETLASALRRRGDLDWVEAYTGGDGVRSDVAARIAGCSVSTIQRQCKVSAEAGYPIGILVAEAAWLISIRRLLIWVEKNEGKSARLEAETRLSKLTVTYPGQNDHVFDAVTAKSHFRG